MRQRTLQIRSALHHWRMHIAVMLGVAAGSAALTGALIVGDSMRGSLKNLALDRLAGVDHAMIAPHFFQQSLAEAITRVPEFSTQSDLACPIILLRGGAIHAQHRTRVDRVNILGVDDSFWNLGTLPNPTNTNSSDAALNTRRSIVVNQPLADDLGIKIGEDILLRMGKPSAISTETLLGRKDDTISTLRLKVSAILPAQDLGVFSLDKRHTQPRNAYVSLQQLQRTLDQRQRVNTLLIKGKKPSNNKNPKEVASLQSILQESVTLADLGITLRIDTQRGYISLESEQMLIDPAIETAAMKTADKLDIKAEPILTHLANAIRLISSTGDPIPYSTIAAIPATGSILSSLKFANNDTLASIRPGEMILNQWAADALNAKPGQRIALDYYVSESHGRLKETQANFVLRGITQMNPVAADPGFIPTYPGVTDTENLADWDAPFPVDFTKIHDQDEAYWDQYKTTPKAFILLEDGQRMWVNDAERLGKLTSIRLYPNTNTNIKDFETVAARFEDEFFNHLPVEKAGLKFDPVRANALAASKGTTDFGGLFIGFSFFLILSAAMLVILLFRLGVERRASEIGLLLATGFTPAHVAWILIGEGAWVAGVGCLLGLFGSIQYASLMLAGLRTWWSDAVNAPFLQLHITSTSLLIGTVSSFVISLLAIAWAFRGLTKSSTRSLLAGQISAHSSDKKTSRRRNVLICTLSFIASILLIVLSTSTEWIPESLAFFFSGAAALTGSLALIRHRLQQDPSYTIHHPGLRAWTQLGRRNAVRNAGRSLLTASLIASATFMIVALEAFRISPDEQQIGVKHSGTGGFALYAESAANIVYDLNSVAGRESLGMTPAAENTLRQTSIIPFRLRGGDDASCLNLYQPTQPRVLGATDAMIERSGFVFSQTLRTLSNDEENPWQLLHYEFDDGAIPVIGDESAVLWQFHSGLGQDLTIDNERGQQITLRFVALLKGSTLQDELIVSEKKFQQLFPSIDGYAFFLIDPPADQVQTVAQIMERELEQFSFDVAPSLDRLTDYLNVQNTYLSTFQSLGGLGLLLGTIGLSAVLLRNVWERKSELALMRALGYSSVSILWMVMVENLAMLVSGLFAGTASALIAISPHLINNINDVPWPSLLLTLLAVLITGMLAGSLAVIPLLRTPLLPALRTE